jgi:hypothetical protein
MTLEDAVAARAAIRNRETTRLRDLRRGRSAGAHPAGNRLYLQVRALVGIRSTLDQRCGDQVSELFRAATVSDPITLAVRLFGAQSRQSIGVGDIPTGSSRRPTSWTTSTPPVTHFHSNITQYLLNM